MPVASGSRLGPYEILAPLGVGGMGEVYKARDPRLGRDVAIKVLPAGLSADPDRLRRFEQEARAAAALNHPNILAVYDVGTHQGSPYVVSELLEGQTLRERLRQAPAASRGAGAPAIDQSAFPVRKAVEYAVQIANGLATAHEKGIVHRDLKPENLFITSDARAKILDFGLAKLTEVGRVLVSGPAGSQEQDPAYVLSALPTRTAGTTPGIVLGTWDTWRPSRCAEDKPAAWQKPETFPSGIRAVARCSTSPDRTITVRSSRFRSMAGHRIRFCRRPRRPGKSFALGTRPMHAGSRLKPTSDSCSRCRRPGAGRRSSCEGAAMSGIPLAGASITSTRKPPGGRGSKRRRYSRAPRHRPLPGFWWSV